MATKKEIIEEHLQEYLAADKERKGEILDAVTEITKLTRKAAIKAFRRRQLRASGRQETRGRPTYYTPDVTAALKDVWEAAGECCGELLHPMIGEYLDILIRDDMWKHGDEATAKLRAMKEHTVRRRVAAFARLCPTAKGLSSTKPSHLKSIIPIFKGPWNDKVPGEGQLDTVAHCGDTLLGDFVYTVNYTDAATYWIIPRAQWNKGQTATVENMVEIKSRLPVRLRAVHPDTGSEFINWVCKNWCDKAGVDLTRSEPGKKNDNMYVEERNGHVVRKYLGYTRLDCPDVVPLVNDLYDELALYLNHFQAVRRTLEKKRVGAKYKRTYERTAKTPYQRMLEHPHVSAEEKKRLKAEHATLNPLVLKRKIDTLITKIMKKQRGHGTHSH